MRLAIIADLRVEHTRRWLKLLEDCHHEILVLSTYPFPFKSDSITIKVLPGLFRPGNSFVKSSEAVEEKPTWRQKIISNMLKLEFDKWLRPIWYRLSVLDVIWQTIATRSALKQFNPSLVQAFRTQNEGYIAGFAKVQPAILFIWGQDFTFFSQKYKVHHWLTKIVLGRLDGLLADCQSDINLAETFGFSPGKPTDVIPGNGGVNLSVYSEGPPIYDRERVIVYPRGFSPYLRLENLIQALKNLFNDSQFEDVRAVLLMPPSLIERTEELVSTIGLSNDQIQIRPFMDQSSWSDLLKQAYLVVSPSTSDGTPNSLLESMACGAFPVMGRLPSIEEWIVDGKNGILFDPEDPNDIEDALAFALSNPKLCNDAQIQNRKIILQRANAKLAVSRLFNFYDVVLANFNY